MRALTLLQPWATLVAIGAKQIETRSWCTTYRGLLAIHASKTFRTSARERCREGPFEDALLRAGYGTWPYVLSEDRLPLGALVAVADLVAVDRIDQVDGDVWLKGADVHWRLPGSERNFGEYVTGRYAWVLAGVRRLATPMPCRGSLGLWEVPADVEEQVEAALR